MCESSLNLDLRLKLDQLKCTNSVYVLLITTNCGSLNCSYEFNVVDTINLIHTVCITHSPLFMIHLTMILNSSPYNSKKKKLLKSTEL